MIVFWAGFVVGAVISGLVVWQLLEDHYVNYRKTPTTEENDNAEAG